jgi:hypothetical protein
MLDNCGRWLYRNSETHLRCSKFLERTAELRKTKFLDDHLNTLIDNAVLGCKPAKTSAQVSDPADPADLANPANPANPADLADPAALADPANSANSANTTCFPLFAELEFFHTSTS